jgi:hypothetical protein
MSADYLLESPECIVLVEVKSIRDFNVQAVKARSCENLKPLSALRSLKKIAIAYTSASKLTKSVISDFFPAKKNT